MLDAKQITYSNTKRKKKKPGRQNVLEISSAVATGNSVQKDKDFSGGASHAGITGMLRFRESNIER
jgi:hypothetical protein